MGSYRLDPTIANVLASDPEVKAKLRKVAADILADAQQNLHSMDAVRSGRLKNSGFVDQDDTGTRVGFDTDYAAIVHEGFGKGRNANPRPYLAEAAARDRGVL